MIILKVITQSPLYGLGCGLLSIVYLLDLLVDELIRVVEHLEPQSINAGDLLERPIVLLEFLNIP